MAWGFQKRSYRLGFPERATDGPVLSTATPGRSATHVLSPRRQRPRAARRQAAPSASVALCATTPVLARTFPSPARIATSEPSEIARGLSRRPGGRISDGRRPLPKPVRPQRAVGDRALGHFLARSAGAVHTLRPDRLERREASCVPVAVLFWCRNDLIGHTWPSNRQMDSPAVFPYTAFSTDARVPRCSATVQLASVPPDGPLPGRFAVLRLSAATFRLGVPRQP